MRRTTIVSLGVAAGILGCTDSLEERTSKTEQALVDLQARATGSEAALQARLSALESRLAAESEARQAAEARVTALEADAAGLGNGLATLQTDVGALQTKQASSEQAISGLRERAQLRNQEEMYVWDGEGRFLGSMAGYETMAITGTIQFVEPNSGLLVLGTNLSDKIWLRFASADCTGAAYLFNRLTGGLVGPSADDVGGDQLPQLAVLDQSTGDIYSQEGFAAVAPTVLSKRDISGKGACVPDYGGVEAGALRLARSQAVTPFARGLQVNQMEW
jgi:hypothetical protein